MGKIPILTKEQKTVLGEIAKINSFKDNFYFTGGTALAAFYLNHRLSEDLDFFSDHKFDNQVILTLIEELSKKLQFKYQSNFREVVYIFNLTFKNGTKLKVDFGYYPYKRLRKGQILESIEIDSLFDIAVNKLQTVRQRSQVKDFVDLYFLLKEFTLWDLMEGARVKFRMEIDPYLVGVDFMKAEKFENLPKMIVPLKLSDLQSFYKNTAKKLGRRAVRE